MYAKHHRVLDLNNFERVILRMFRTDERIADHLLSKIKFDRKQKKKDLRLNVKAAKKSNYKFALRPVNGKDITTIERELSNRKL